MKTAEWINIFSATDFHWEMYHRFYEILFPDYLKKIEDDSIDFKDAMFKQVSEMNLLSYILIDGDKCTANIKFYNEDVLNKTLDMKFNVLPDYMNEETLENIKKLLYHMLDEKKGYYLILITNNELSSEFAGKFNIFIKDSFFTLTLQYDDVDIEFLSESYKKLKPSFEKYEVKKFINLPDEILADCFNFINILQSDFSSRRELSLLGRSIDEMRNTRDEIIEHGSERVSYIMYDTNGKIIGLTELDTKPDYLYTPFTGVDKNFRGKGIAKYLKILSILDSIESKKKFKYIKTRTNCNNAPMNKLNSDLGFTIKDKTYEYNLK